jgi:hypothetical protein
MKKSEAISVEKPTYWQLVFQQSKANEAVYQGEQLAGQTWNWPKDTYLQRRLREQRRGRFAGNAESTYRQ